MLSPVLESAIARTESTGFAPAVAPPTPAIDAAIESTIAERDAAARKVATAAAGKLEAIIAAGMAGARETVQRVMSEVPTDYLVPAKAIRWDVGSRGDAGVTIDGVTSLVHRNALSQAMGRYDLPARYALGLPERGEWGRDLARHVLNQHAENDSGRVLVRKVGNTIRAILSDSYRRMDSRPMLDAFLAAINAAGLVVFSGRATDVKVAMRAILPRVIDIAGDPVVFGLEWSNSDYGAGKHLVSAYVLRLLCLNGATGESVMSNVHLGKRIEGDAKLSQRTHDLDTQTMVSAIGDVVASTAGPAAMEKQIERVRKAATERIELGDSVPAALTRALSKSEQDRMRELFASAESVMLPPEPTRYRLSNVLSWMANTADTPDRAIELERLAGQIVGV